MHLEKKDNFVYWTKHHRTIVIVETTFWCVGQVRPRKTASVEKVPSLCSAVVNPSSYNKSLCQSFSLSLSVCVCISFSLCLSLRLYFQTGGELHRRYSQRSHRPLHAADMSRTCGTHTRWIRSDEAQQRRGRQSPVDLDWWLRIILLCPSLPRTHTRT